MAKEAFYFSHDYGARNDPKLQKVLMELGHEGKSVFWDLIEMLYEEGGYLLISELKSYAFALRTDLDRITKLINDFDLFSNNSVNFWSNTVLRRLDVRDSKSKKASESAQSRWDKANASKNHANASKSDAIKERKEKEKKEKEIKVNIEVVKRFTPPHTEEIENFFSLNTSWEEQKIKNEAGRFFNFYDSKNWFVGKNKMSKWKSAGANWINRSNEDATKQPTTIAKTGFIQGNRETLNKFANESNRLFQQIASKNGH